MPQLFAADQHGDVERYAVASYLARQEGPLAIVPDAAGGSDSSIGGRRRPALSASAVPCAMRNRGTGRRVVTLRALAQKTTPEAIEAFLQKPEAVAPAGRMPTFVLGKLAKRQLAMYLMSLDNATAGPLELPAPPRPMPCGPRLRGLQRMKPRGPNSANSRPMRNSRPWDAR